ncbi:MAG: hypothetical protein ACYSTX_04500, partial [Planctomycetota bacterium]
QKPFRDQFFDKILADSGKALTIKRAGNELGQSEVRAVTGATQTSVRLEKIINSAVENWRKQLNK